MSSGENIADALSRLTKIVASNQSQDDNKYVRMVALHAAPVALKIKETEFQPKILNYRPSGGALLKKGGKVPHSSSCQSAMN